MTISRGLIAALAVAVVGASIALTTGSLGADEATVVVSRPGTVFHKAGGDDIRGRGHLKSLSEALAAGYSPCQVCFAKEATTSRALTTSATMAGATSLSSGRTILAATPPSSGPVTTPFGLKRASFDRGGNGDAVKDPYSDLDTVRNPGSEQGAYCKCQLCGHRSE